MLKLVRFFAWTVLVGSALVLVAALLTPYDQAIRFVTSVTHYQNVARLKWFLTPRIYYQVRLLPVAGIVLGILMLKTPAFLREFFRQRVYYFGRGLRYWRETIDRMPSYERLTVGAFLGIYVLLISILAVTTPVIYTEAWTWLNYTIKGIGTSAGVLINPTSSPLYAALTNITHLFPWPALVTLRLPAMIAGFLFIVSMYALLRRIAGIPFALCILPVTACLYPVFYHAFTGSGFSLMLLCFAAMYHSAFYQLQGKFRQPYLFFYSLASITGLITAPLFVFPYLALSVFLFFNIRRTNEKGRWQFILSNAITVITSLWCYLPVILISGPKALLFEGLGLNPGIHRPWKETWDNFNSAFDVFLGFPGAALAAIGLIVIAWLLNRRSRPAQLNLWILLFGILTIRLLPPVSPSDAWIYMAVLLPVSGALLVRALPFLPAGRKGTWAGACASVILVVLLVASDTRRFNREEDYSFQADKTCRFMISRGIRSVFVHEPLMDVYVGYAYSARRLPLALTINPLSYAADPGAYQSVLTADSSLVAGSAPIYHNAYYSLFISQTAAPR